MDILALHLQPFLEYAYVRGLSPQELMRDASLTTDKVDATTTVNTTQFYGVLERLHQALQDDAVGWRVGSLLNLKALGLIYQISLEATTVEEAIYYLKSYIQATFPLVKLSVVLGESANVLEVSISTGKDLLNRIVLESLLVVMAKELRLMSTHPVSMTVSSPHYTSAYPENFQYGKKYQVVFGHVALKATLRTFESVRLSYLIPEYLKLIQRLTQQSSLSNRVKIVALNMAKPQLPTMEEVADSFHLTPRTFQRMLAQEKITFRAIAEDLKKQLSSLLLHHQHYSIGDISYLLNYSEPAAFIHAYKKWFGHSPGVARGRIRNEAT